MSDTGRCFFAGMLIGCALTLLLCFGFVKASSGSRKAEAVKGGYGQYDHSTGEFKYGIVKENAGK